MNDIFMTLSLRRRGRRRIHSFNYLNSKTLRFCFQLKAIKFVYRRCCLNVVQCTILCATSISCSPAVCATTTTNCPLRKQKEIFFRFVNIAFSGFFGILIRSFGDSHTLAHAMECLFYMKKCSRRTTRCCRWLLLLVVCVPRGKATNIGNAIQYFLSVWHSFSYFFVCILFGGPLSTLEANGTVVNVVNVAT